MQTVNSPSSRFINPNAAELDEDMIDMSEEASDAARKRGREDARMNKISTYLGERFFRTCKTWPFLYWKMAGVQLSVDMYFPSKNLAVDRFPRPTSLDRQAAAFKAMALRTKGVNYIALFPENKLADLAKYK